MMVYAIYQTRKNKEDIFAGVADSTEGAINFLVSDGRINRDTFCYSEEGVLTTVIERFGDNWEEIIRNLSWLEFYDVFHNFFELIPVHLWSKAN